MKNFLILGLLALTLFSVSAALSIWLNQSKQTEADKDKKEKDPEKVTAKTSKGGDPREEPKPAGKVDLPPTGTEAARKDLLRQQDAAARRADRIDLVVRDLQTVREANESLLRQVTTELKLAAAEVAKAAAATATEATKPKAPPADLPDPKNLARMATAYEAMAPETAAALIKEMADKGQMDLAARVLAQMKERNVANVLGALNDPALGTELTGRVLKLKPASGGTPAKGP